MHNSQLPAMTRILPATVGSTILAALLLIGDTPTADSHMYIVDPVSRHYLRSRIFESQESDVFESCPRCFDAGGVHAVPERGLAKTQAAWLREYGEGYFPLKWVFDKGEMAENGNYLEPDEIAVRHGVCGDPRNDQPETSNRYGTPNVDWPVLTEYAKGDSIELKIHVGSHHWGHIEFFVCDTADLDDPDGVVTQGCFNQHPLTRSSGDSVYSPVDPNYPGRYYINPACTEFESDVEKDLLYETTKGFVLTMNYDLPEDLTCEHCVLQMVWYTGVRCKFPGYDEFNPTSWPSKCGPDKSDWIYTDTWECGSHERAYAQQFWGCSDFSILEQC